MKEDILLGKLPDVFTFANGKKVQTVEEWQERRKQIINTAVELEYGGMPPVPDAVRLEKLTENGLGRAACYRVHCLIGEKDFTFCFTAYLPNEGEKWPVILTGDGMYYKNLDNQVIEEAHRRGFLVVKFNRTEFAHDMYNTSRDTGLYPYFPQLGFSAISAWAWGYHRVIDALFELPYVDTDHIILSGHSRGGKTVLLAGALDDRVFCTNPNGSGAHGCGCYRYIQQEEEGLYAQSRSERLEDLFGPVPYWLGAGMRSYIDKEEKLPHDMHFIKALIAPRAFLETNGRKDIWANPKGSYLTHLAAKEVWKLYGAEERCQTWYGESGHRHGWEQFNALFDFVETLLSEEKKWRENVPYQDIFDIYEQMKG